MPECRNGLGEELGACSIRKKTGFYGAGCCETGPLTHPRSGGDGVRRGRYHGPRSGPSEPRPTPGPGRWTHR
jgi:hypothetical protein